MKTLKLVLLLACFCVQSGCIWVGTTITGEAGLYYKPPYSRENYQMRSPTPFWPYQETSRYIVGYKEYPDTWPFWY